MSTHWRLYWNLVKEKEAWVKQLLKKSAVGAPNQGSVFNFQEFQALSTTLFDSSMGLPFPVWIQKRFMATSLLFGALRSEQLERFRQGGLESIEFLTDNKNTDHQFC